MPPPHQPVDPRASFPKLEERVLARWRERDVFAESVRRRDGAPAWGFYEGPPTANAAPGTHHVLARVFKDIFPRYRTMRGYQVVRKGGWDCHGLPVELAVEAELGITSKDQIEEFGIAQFNARCREKVLSHVEDWRAMVERVGHWIDLDDAYRTLDPDYIDSVWWALKTIHEKGLLYEKLKVVPYCPRCGTALSSHELGQPGVYQDVVDPSVFVRFRLLPLERAESLLVWTTTPWTLPGNEAVAVNPEIDYARVRSGDETLILAAGLVERVLGSKAEMIEQVRGSRLVGEQYAHPILNLGDREPGGHPVIEGEFVSTQDGTGLVHIAPAFGEEDFYAAAKAGLFDPTDGSTLYNPVRLDGTFDGRLRDRDGNSYEGRAVKDPAVTADLIEDLKARGLLFKAEVFEHSYPHCWRCDTPLLYYAKPSWYIATSQIRDRLLASNEAVTWYPEHVKHGRFGNWLEGNVDWALSRERYWGTPLPVWRCAQHHITVLGSLAELNQRAGTNLTDPHRPFVDEPTFACPECQMPARRVEEVIDVWFDSGSMPFAQYHAPHEREDTFSQHFPADFICEGLDQTRGWFYSLLAVATLLFGRSSYEHVVCLGLILDERGRKMSKRLGNVVEPQDVIDRYGADALRWYFFTSKQPWDGYRLSLETIGEAVRQFLLQLWNTYGFYVLYANANGIERPLAARYALEEDLDRWILSRLSATTETVAERLEDFDATGGGRAIAAFVDALSNWYVRRSRRRFWDGDPSAFATLHTCLTTTATLLAPFCPFLADEIYENLDGREPSIHLLDFPQPGFRDPELEQAMTVARETVRLGLAARAQAKLKVRQPLRAAVVVATGFEREAIERFADVVQEELNVRELRFVSQADELGEIAIKPNYRTLGPRFGAQMPLAAAAIAGLDAAHAAAALRDGGRVAFNLNGHDYELAPDDVLISMKPLEGYEVEREGSHAVALELEIDAELRVEGWAREIVHAIQAARRAAGLEVSDRILLTLDGDAELLSAAQAHEPYIAGETLAVQTSYERLGDGVEPLAIDGRELRVGVALA